MGTPFLGEIRQTSFGFAPKGWALCNGQLLPISQNQALFAILGTTYGGNGQTTFALPDLRGRSPAHAGGTMTLGESVGAEAHTLTVNEIPAHAHGLQGSTDLANNTSPEGNLLAAKGRGGKDIYAPGASTLQPMSPQAIAPSGASQPHENMQPFLTLNFIIALTGIFPSRN
ncbi:tail collar protein [Aquabacterium sp. NJ1]|uniref:phage tail protein n=1 Tax=Aquabacterium sp. NJ1 TaxID=1538295 RepID=UPI00052CA390|nr:tail fiber protein [Aquabacterium sp. NJ1]KGM40535.1 tail collar protein [Aquabacterium sp. NJ1]